LLWTVYFLLEDLQQKDLISSSAADSVLYSPFILVPCSSTRNKTIIFLLFLNLLTSQKGSRHPILDFYCHWEISIFTLTFHFSFPPSSVYACIHTWTHICVHRGIENSAQYLTYCLMKKERKKAIKAVYFILFPDSIFFLSFNSCIFHSQTS